MYKSEIKDYDLDLYIPNFTSELVGYSAIAFVCLVTLIISVMWKDISKIIWAALSVRLIFLLVGHYFIHLPDSTNDALGFEAGAWMMAQNGFLNSLENFPGFNSFFYSWIISIPYSLFGRSILMMQSIGLLFGLGSVFLGWYVAKKLWDFDTSIKVGWILALFPSLVLYSVLPLREVYSSFFILLAISGIVGWVKNNSYTSIILAFIGFLGAFLFHGALIIGFIIFGTILLLNNSKVFLNSLKKLRLNQKSLVILIVTFVLLGAFYSNKINVQYIQSFEISSKMGTIKDTILVRLKGDASYSNWTQINSLTEISYKIPVRVAYFLFSPFPWDVSKPNHIIGLCDSLMYMALIYLIICNRKSIWQNPALRIIFIILLAYLIVYSIGVSNFGAGIRHRSKFVIGLILLAGPLIPKLILSKKKLIKSFK